MENSLLVIFDKIHGLWPNFGATLRILILTMQSDITIDRRSIKTITCV